MVAYTNGSPGIEGFGKVAAAVPWGEGPGVFKVSFDFDWAQVAKARSDAGLAALVAGDVITLGLLPKGALLLASAGSVVTPNSAAAVISLGITGTAGALAAALDTGAAAGTVTVYAVAPVLVTADIAIILTLTALPVKGRTRVTALFANML